MKKPPFRLLYSKGCQPAVAREECKQKDSFSIVPNLMKQSSQSEKKNQNQTLPRFVRQICPSVIAHGIRELFPKRAEKVYIFKRKVRVLHKKITQFTTFGFHTNCYYRYTIVMTLILMGQVDIHHVT